MKETIHTDDAPNAVGPYSQAVGYENLVFISGQIGIDPDTGILAGGIESQTRTTLENIGELLKAASSDFDKVLKTTIYLKDLKDYKTVNSIYAMFFKTDPPARATLQVAAIPMGALVEIEMIAYREKDD
jgi:2-iminobutanoate/2-iminopropanoate deaminase